MGFLGSTKDLSLIVASWTAIYGIDSWRREYRGKKRAELAEEALCLFYEGRDAIRHIRNPFAHGEEGKTRKVGEDETPEEKEAYDKAYVLIERYNSHIELFNKLHSMRYRFMAQFGVESGKPFEDFRRILNKVLVSAQSLARSWAQQLRSYRIEQEDKQRLDFIQKQETIFWEGLADEDPISPKVDECIEEIEKICRPILSGKPTILSSFAFKALQKIREQIAKLRLHKDRS